MFTKKHWATGAFLFSTNYKKIMGNSKKTGIYLNHFIAQVIEYSKMARIVKVIRMDFNTVEEENSVLRGESHLFNTQDELHNEFYAELSQAVLNYKQLIIFGPTTAKNELHNRLSNDNRFTDVEITIKNTDELTSEDQLEFINNCFYLDNQ